MATVDGLKMSKKDQALLREKLNKACMEIGSNRDFVAERFAEHMEQVVEEGKKELNAYAQRTLAPGALTLGSSAPPVLRLSNGPEEAAP